MAKREVVTLNETTPQLEAPQTGDTYQLPRDVALTTGVISSEVADGASAVAFSFNSENTLSTAGAKIVSIKNNGTEAFRVGKDSSVVMGANDANSSLTYTVGSYEALLTALYTLSLNANVLFKKATTTAALSTTSIGYNGVQFEPVTRDITIGFRENWGYDQAVKTLTISGANNYASATTNLLGGNLIISGGGGSSGSAGNAHGGNVTITGGTGYGTGHDGYILMTNLPTSDPGVTGALWNNSGVLTIS